MPSANATSEGSQSSGFLAHLPATIRRLPYEGIGRFLNTYSKEYDRLQQDPTGEATSEWILFHINAHTFAQEFLNSTTRSNITKSWSSYSASEQLLLVKMMTPEHSHARTAFHDALRDTLKPMGLERQLQTFSGKTVKSEQKSKQGDHGWGPLRQPRDRSREWPTVVLEVAVSETEAKLKSDVRYWLYESRGDVKVVLTVAINRRAPEIVIEKWELPEDERRTHRTQRVVISKTKTETKTEINQITVLDGPLIIEFPKLFLRPTMTPVETDIRIDREKLEALATSIWCIQDF